MNEFFILSFPTGKVTTKFPQSMGQPIFEITAKIKHYLGYKVKKLSPPRYLDHVLRLKEHRFDFGEVHEP